MKQLKHEKQIAELFNIYQEGKGDLSYFVTKAEERGYTNTNTNVLLHEQASKPEANP